MKMTDRELRVAIHALGLNLRKIDGEYRVSRTGDDEALAYYTDDRADALDTARHMAASRCRVFLLCRNEATTSVDFGAFGDVPSTVVFGRAASCASPAM